MVSDLESLWCPKGAAGWEGPGQEVQSPRGHWGSAGAQTPLECLLRTDVTHNSDYHSSVDRSILSSIVHRFREVKQPDQSHTV